VEPDTSLTGALAIARSDRGARIAWWVALPLSLVLLVIVGRHQWFIRDDWAFVFTRAKIRDAFGVDDMLMFPQDGHWMPWPILVYRLLQSIFGLGSYWPFLAVLLATHIGIVLLVRQVCRRLEVSAWTTTLICSVLLVFGGGWENIVFAVQITYNFSLLAFLGHLLLVDHDGPVDRRDWTGVGISLIGVSSSGFGPFFAFGVGILLVARRRWKAAAVAVIPQAIAWSWWWFTWGADPAGEQGEATVISVLRFVRFGLVSTFASMTATGLLAEAALLVTLALAVWKGTGDRRRPMVLALWATTLAMFLGIGIERVGIGLALAASSRYQYMAAMMLAPVLALGLDQAHRFAPWARWIPRVVLVIAVGRNAVWLSDYGGDWAQRAAEERNIFSLVAGSPERSTADPDHWMVPFSPDVRISDLDQLVEDGAITPRAPATPEERALVARALAQPVP
jgi:hypothetical protein